MQPLAAASPGRQKGAVAILVGFSLVVLVMMLGLVLDLGQLYITRTELQNAADAAALAGAKELNGTLTGINNAVTRARNTAAANSTRFGANAGAVQITAANIKFYFLPSDDEDDWLTVSDAQAAPAGLSFIKVDTNEDIRNPNPIPQGRLRTWFMQVCPSFICPGGLDPNRTTFGRAVAGTLSADIMPMGVCALDPNNATAQGATAGGSRELVEFGFRRGMAYDILTINDEKQGLAGLNQVPLWINPVDRYPGPCSEEHGNAQFLRQFICTGQSSSIPVVPGGRAYINPGTDNSQQRPLNSRFIDPGNFCTAGTAPRDANIKEYLFDPPPPPLPSTPRFDCSQTSINARCGYPRDWTDSSGNSLPSQQSVKLTGYTPSPTVPGDFGVLWSYSRAVRYDSSAPGNVGTEFDTDAWPELYAGLQADTQRGAAGPPPTNHYGYPASTDPTPYNQTSGKYLDSFFGGLRNRRVLNLAIINCDVGAGGAGACRDMPVLGIGRFFMPIEADPPQHIELEFAGVVPPSQLERKIRLFR